jgi:hypothetical protein
LAAGLLVGVPIVLLAGLSDRTGVVRAQDPAVVQARADAGRILAGRSPYSPPPETSPRGREAFSRSFRLDPTAEIRPSSPILPPGPSLVAGLVRPLGIRDLRLPAGFALAILAVVLAVVLEGRRRRGALALALLLGPMASAPCSGRHALSLAALVAAWAAGRRGTGLPSGLLAGAAIALDHRAALVAPFLLVPLGSRSTRPGLESRPAVLRGLGGAVGAYLLLVGPIALLDPASFVARLVELPVPGVGLGLVNLLAYRGGKLPLPRWLSPRSPRSSPRASSCGC